MYPFLLPRKALMLTTVLQVSSLLEQTTVLLRMQAGSTEAGFLAAFCPLENIPAFVVVQYVL
jgi:hypothetical protein